MTICPGITQPPSARIRRPQGRQSRPVIAGGCPVATRAPCCTGCTTALERRSWRGSGRRPKVCLTPRPLPEIDGRLRIPRLAAPAACRSLPASSRSVFGVGDAGPMRCTCGRNATGGPWSSTCRTGPRPREAGQDDTWRASVPTAVCVPLGAPGSRRRRRSGARRDAHTTT